MADLTRQTGQLSLWACAKQSGQGTQAGSPTNQVLATSFDLPVNQNNKQYKSLGSIDSVTEGREGIAEITLKMPAHFRGTMGMPLVCGAIGFDTFSGAGSVSLGTLSASTTANATFIPLSAAIPATPAGVVDWAGAAVTVDTGATLEDLPIFQVCGITTIATAPTIVGSGTGGTLAAATYTYEYAPVTGCGSAGVSAASGSYVASGSTSSVVVTVPAIASLVGSGITQVNILRSSGGVYTVVGNIPAASLSATTAMTFTDTGFATGAATPGATNLSFGFQTSPALYAHTSGVAATILKQHCFQPNTGANRASLSWFSVWAQWSTMRERQAMDGRCFGFEIKSTNSEDMDISFDMVFDATLVGGDIFPTTTTISAGTGEAGDVTFKHQDGTLYTFGALADIYSYTVRKHQRLIDIDYKLTIVPSNVKEGGNPQSVIQHLINERTQMYSWSDTDGEQAFRTMRLDFVQTSRVTPTFAVWKNPVTNAYFCVFTPRGRVMGYEPTGPQQAPISVRGSISGEVDNSGYATVAATGQAVRIWSRGGNVASLY